MQPRFRDNNKKNYLVMHFKKDKLNQHFHVLMHKTSSGSTLFFPKYLSINNIHVSLSFHRKLGLSCAYIKLLYKSYLNAKGNVGFVVRNFMSILILQSS